MQGMAAGALLRVFGMNLHGDAASKYPELVERTQVVTQVDIGMIAESG